MLNTFVARLRRVANDGFKNSELNVARIKQVQKINDSTLSKIKHVIMCV